MEKNPLLDLQLPPGFRFHPSDEELIVHYLRKKAFNSPLPAPIVADVELYKYNPWDLPMKSTFGDEEWYFFTPRDRKYPNGMRPNRMADSGYWKATGIDKPILSSCGSKIIGVKKALIFYVGKPPRGRKTDWLMQEYRLPELEQSLPNYKERSMRLDDWVLCRIWQKTRMSGNMWEEKNGPSPSREPLQFLPQMEREHSNEEVAAEHQRIQPESFATDETLPAPPSESGMIRESFLKECPNMLPILFAHLPHDKLYPSLTSTSSGLNYQTNNNEDDDINNTQSSLCEDSFNLDNLPNPMAILGKRKLPFELGIHETNSNNKRMDSQTVRIDVPQSPDMDNNNLTANGMASYNETAQVEKNNDYNVEQVGSTMYQDLYSIAFTYH